MGNRNKIASFLIASCLLTAFICIAASATTTELHIVKYAADNTTILGEKTVTYQWMETNLPVYGNGITHYYHQGPVFIDDVDEAREQELRWNAAEDTNVKEKDMGAVKGTAVKDLCDLVGGMTAGDTVTIKATDGFKKTFAYKNVYTPPARQGEMIVAWYRPDAGYVPDYREGMRLIFLADNSTNPYGLNIFGSNDWHESAEPQYYYYYQQGDPVEKYPTTTGLSVQIVSEIRINSGANSAVKTVEGTQQAAATTPNKAGTPFFIPLVATVLATAIIAQRLRENQL